MTTPTFEYDRIVLTNEEVGNCSIQDSAGEDGWEAYGVIPGDRTSVILLKRQASAKWEYMEIRVSPNRTITTELVRRQDDMWELFTIVTSTGGEQTLILRREQQGKR